MAANSHSTTCYYLSLNYLMMPIITICGSITVNMLFCCCIIIEGSLMAASGSLSCLVTVVSMKTPFSLSV